MACLYHRCLYHRCLYLALFCFFLQYNGLLVALKFSDVSDRVRLGDVSGKIAAFADFNSDKATDFLVLNNTGK